MSETLLRLHAALEEAQRLTLQAIVEEKDAKRRAICEAMDDAEWTMAMGDPQRGFKTLPRFPEPYPAPIPSHPHVAPCTQEIALNAEPHMATHDVALDEEYTERLDRCAE